MVIWVHLLRAAAALAVMFAHVHQSAQATGIGDYVPDFTIGAAGVDLFFVISGFVMVIASASLFGHAASPVYFFLRRVARIVPLYWFASGVALCVIYLIWAHFEPTNISFRNIITSLFFIPDARPDGVVQPIYSLGWTLNFEMALRLVFPIPIPSPAPGYSSIVDAHARRCLYRAALLATAAVQLLDKSDHR